MKLFFQETSAFTDWVREQPEGWDTAFASLQLQLMADPESGKVMKACGGLRKVRMPDPSRGKGKRGGARIVYLHLPEADCVYMIDAYGKDEKDDLTPDDRKAFATFARIAKEKLFRATEKLEE